MKGPEFPDDEEIPGRQEEPINPLELDQIIKRFTELVRNKEGQFGHLGEDEKQEIIDGIREINILEGQDETLDIGELVGELTGLLESHDIPDPDEILRDIGLQE